MKRMRVVAESSAHDTWMAFERIWGEAIVESAEVRRDLNNLRKAVEDALATIDRTDNIWYLATQISKVIEAADYTSRWLSKSLEETKPEGYDEIITKLKEEQDRERLEVSSNVSRPIRAQSGESTPTFKLYHYLDQIPNKGISVVYGYAVHPDTWNHPADYETEDVSFEKQLSYEGGDARSDLVVIDIYDSKQKVAEVNIGLESEGWAVIIASTLSEGLIVDEENFEETIPFDVLAKNIDEFIEKFVDDGTRFSEEYRKLLSYRHSDI